MTRWERVWLSVILVGEIALCVWLLVSAFEGVTIW